MSDLEDWRPGARFRLLDYGTIDPSFRGRLLAMGMTLGVEVSIIRIAPLGDPIQLDLRGLMLGMRRKDLHVLHWKKL